MQAKNILRFSLFFLTGVMVFPTLQAQNWAEELAQIRNVHKNADRLFFEMITTEHEGTIANVVSKTVATAYREGQNYLYKTPDGDILANQSLKLMVNHEAKIISYAEGRQKEELESLTPSQLLEGFMRSFTTKRYVGLEKGLKHYQFTNPKSMISKVDVYIDPAKHIFKKIQYEYNEKIRDKGWVVILMNKFDTSPQIPSNLFDHRKYIVKSGENDIFEPSKEYKEYSIQKSN